MRRPRSQRVAKFALDLAPDPAHSRGDNDSLVLYENGNSIWKLEQAWTDFSREPGSGTPNPFAP